MELKTLIKDVEVVEKYNYDENIEITKPVLLMFLQLV